MEATLPGKLSLLFLQKEQAEIWDATDRKGKVCPVFPGSRSRNPWGEVSGFVRMSGCGWILFLVFILILSFCLDSDSEKLIQGGMGLLEYQWWVVTGLLGVMFFMVINRSVKKPLVWMGKGMLSTAVGALVLFVLNLLGQYVQIHIPINLWTAFVTGCLGIPGIAYLVAVKIIFIGL
ncbi:MAG: pro-sigmaK processing inhibitor BofA family protein [Thermoactinomyces vulgaris]|jgi:inhibitor of the pro-sigma K processing machinery